VDNIRILIDESALPKWFDRMTGQSDALDTYICVKIASNVTIVETKTVSCFVDCIENIMSQTADVFKAIARAEDFNCMELWDVQSLRSAVELAILTFIELEKSMP
jgi:hypothetical protein